MDEINLNIKEMMEHIGSISAILFLLLRAMFDNFQLISIAIYIPTLSVLLTDYFFRLFLVYCAGIVGRLLLIGPFSWEYVGGLEKIRFFCYFKELI